MENQRILHEAAMAMAKRLVERISALLRPEEHKDAFEEFYIVCKAGIEAYLVECERQRWRMRPLDG